MEYSIDPLKQLLEIDPFLEPYRKTIRQRLKKTLETEQRLLIDSADLVEFSSGHEFFGLHFEHNIWVFREWAPNATAVTIIGDMTDWQERPAYALKPAGSEGIWEIKLPPDALEHENLYRLRIHWPGGNGDRIPAYANRVVQDQDTLIFNAQVWQPATPFQWRCDHVVKKTDGLLIYEAHIGMSQEAEKTGSYLEFKQNTLPRIVAAGYNTLQLMGIQEHPYYGSFGYQVSSFFAASSRFGTPEDLKSLIDTAHSAGLAVVIDLVHSHSVSNQVEGLSCQDGTLYQYFHNGPRGFHQAWGSRCFDYGKTEVLHFLLSNCRFWLDEYHVDGFRFDGVTSMLYTHHGLEKAFLSYNDYYNSSVDEDALVYLWLANKLVHTLRPDAVTIAEDISGMPGLALPLHSGGTGFDFRFAMGIPDYWVRLIKETRDENWPLGSLWYELTNRRPGEKTISYAESHDQALVGDQTLSFRLMGSDMYDHMHAEDDHLAIDRGMALHKLIRLITLATAGNGYLNFMGNEFGHPEWIDFPREENSWSYRYARRQWHLVDDPQLKYACLNRFDRDMLAWSKKFHILKTPDIIFLYENLDDKIIVFQRAGLIFAFNFHPTQSYTDYRLEAAPGNYRMVFDSDFPAYGGHGRLLIEQVHFAMSVQTDGAKTAQLSLYLPSRTAIVLKQVD
jgi:1,4-alpha-glucan branching enzyme